MRVSPGHLEGRPYRCTPPSRIGVEIAAHPVAAPSLLSRSEAPLHIAPGTRSYSWGAPRSRRDGVHLGVISPGNRTLPPVALLRYLRRGGEERLHRCAWVKEACEHPCRIKHIPMPRPATTRDVGSQLPGALALDVRRVQRGLPMARQAVPFDVNVRDGPSSGGGRWHRVRPPDMLVTHDPPAPSSHQSSPRHKLRPSWQASRPSGILLAPATQRLGFTFDTISQFQFSLAHFQVSSV